MGHCRRCQKPPSAQSPSRCWTPCVFHLTKSDVKQGETINIIIKNTGAMLHEFVIGTQKELEEHAALMVKFPNYGARRALHGACASGQNGQDYLDNLTKLVILTLPA